MDRIQQEARATGLRAEIEERFYHLLDKTLQAIREMAARVWPDCRERHERDNAMRYRFRMWLRRHDFGARTHVWEILDAACARRTRNRVATLTDLRELLEIAARDIGRRKRQTEALPATRTRAAQLFLFQPEDVT